MDADEPERQLEIDSRREHAEVGSEGRVYLRESFYGEHQHRAAHVIQNAWRGLTFKRTFAFYRQVLTHRAAGNPAKLLRSINPREAQLLDKAAGVHVKFRLGGDTFPPAIYYRIFTHRPVEDLCANSPKDYTVHTLKLPTAREHNLKVEGGAKAKPSKPEQLGRSGWYRRWENNGWRQVSDTPSFMAIADPVTADSSCRRTVIHHNKAKRREDLLRERKRRKIEWMVKLYREGYVKTNTCPDVTFQASADGDPSDAKDNLDIELQATRRVENEDSGEEDDAEELLCWTAGLDYEEYLADWQSIGTSAPSDLEPTKELDRRSALQAGPASKP